MDEEETMDEGKSAQPSPGSMWFQERRETVMTQHNQHTVGFLQLNTHSSRVPGSQRIYLPVNPAPRLAVTSNTTLGWTNQKDILEHLAPVTLNPWGNVAHALWESPKINYDLPLEVTSDQSEKGQLADCLGEVVGWQSWCGGSLQLEKKKHAAIRKPSTLQAPPAEVF
ncbi:hypothetical protein Bbelb_345650 [Branchiostoma belcheri]|nr:hypothetical protein Bbelb_345650 [Branchiostoma belcheri]